MATEPSIDKVGVMDKATTEHEAHPAGHIKYGGLRQVARLCLFTTYFTFVVFAIVTTQLIGAPLYFFNKPMYYAWMARTKGHFGVATTAVTQWWSPTVIRVTGDKTVRHQLKKTVDGRLECDFPERMILIANHQLYSDWLYLWWIAYTARLHRFLYIILKESLKYVPILGQGMQFYGFIFLARKWQMDKPRFMHRLSKLSNTSENGNSPMWLLIFPEGTNASDNGRRTSAKYSEKIGVEDLKHTLLPRTTGLSYCLQQLEDSVEWVYDCAVAYEGVPRGKFGQDYFTLYSTFFEGRPPKSVNMHFRRYRVSTIPFHDAEAFEKWLRERWVEKDNLIEYYMENGRFPEDEETDSLPNGNGYLTSRKDKSKRVKAEDSDGEKSAWSGPVETEVKLESAWEVLEQFTVIGTLGLFIHIVSTIWKMVFAVTTSRGLAETPSPEVVAPSAFTA